VSYFTLMDLRERLFAIEIIWIFGMRLSFCVPALCIRINALTLCPLSPAERGNFAADLRPTCLARLADVAGFAKNNSTT